MAYHSHKFEDASIIVFHNNKPVALFPANKVDHEIFSHQGLTYGGLIFSPELSLQKTLESFKAVLEFYYKNNIETIYLKTIPKIYCDNENFPIDYFLKIIKAERYRADLLSVLKPTQKRYSKGRIEGYKRGLKNQLKVKEVDTFNDFWNKILIPNLSKKHKTKPVHSLNEITLLKSRFKQKIRQFNVYYKDTIVAGTTIFETKHVAHAQYISGNSDKNTLGSLDFLHIYLLENVFNKKKYFDFGMSNINEGKQINYGLLFWKEGFGARAITQDFYRITTKNFKLLDIIFV